MPEKKTPTKIEVTPGSYDVTYHKSGFKDARVTINVKEGETIEAPARFTILINDWIREKGGKKAITVANINELTTFFLGKDVDITLKDVLTALDAFLS